MAITMKNLNDRISTLEGKASTTPINMKNLSDRLANLEATAKKWEIVTYPSGEYGKSKTLTIPAHLVDYNFAVISISETYVNTLFFVSSSPTSVNGESVTTAKIGGGMWFTKSGSTIVASRNSNITLQFGQIQIMFYK